MRPVLLLTIIFTLLPMTGCGSGANCYPGEVNLFTSPLFDTSVLVLLVVAFVHASLFILRHATGHPIVLRENSPSEALGKANRPLDSMGGWLIAQMKFFGGYTLPGKL